ncbi:MAG: cell wall-active antibiotics response protein [Treponema sp.]|nr:cell wall-active antibiotics response protein [Treponema sp.]
MDNLLIEIDERKNKIAEKLSSQYSVNLISLEEYERLVEYSQKIETKTELMILEKIVDGRNVSQANYESRPQLQNIDKEYTNILSTRTISGPMVSGTITNILGETKITLTEDDLINDETVIHVSSILGSINISLSGNIDVICNAIPILGEVSNKNKKHNEYGKKLIIKGTVLLGEIRIKNK